MIRWVWYFLTGYGRPPDPPNRVWVFREVGGPWVKVVSSYRPTGWNCLGPLRSEVDAEETAERLNRERISEPGRVNS